MEKAETNKIIKFSDVKEEIIRSIEEKSAKLNILEPVSLIDGFISEPYSIELSNTITLGGPTIPMVMLLGNETGQIYFFAYKALIKKS